jgi:TRAP-type C4-dicarboxylate transport system permease small subunit
MNHLVNNFFRLLKLTIVLCLAGMVVLVFGNVVLRYGFDSGITLSEELSRWLFVWLTFVGAAVAMREHGHLGMDSFVQKLPKVGKQICLVLSILIMLGCTTLFLIGSWKTSVLNINTTAPSTGFSMSMFYGVGVLFSGLAIATLIHDLFNVITGRFSEDELVVVKESEDEEAFKELQSELGEQAMGNKKIDSDR